MAAPTEIKVVINGESYGLQKATKEGEASVEKLTDRVSKMAKAFAAFVVGSAIANFFKESVQEAANAEKGMARLGVAVTNTGNDFKALSPALEQTVKSVQRMSTATDDDLREALTRMISVSGDVSGSMANLSVVADFAAYKQIGVADAADIVAKAMAGNFTALNKMGIAGKDVTTVMENLRTAVGGQAAAELKTFGGAITGLTNQWGEFKEALGAAILSGGGMAGATGTLTGKLVELEDWVVQNAATIGAFANALAGAVAWLVKATVAVVDWVQKAGIEAATLWMSVGPTFRNALGQMLQAMGDFLGQNRVLLTIFGDGLTEVADGMANTGAKMQREAVRALGLVRQAHDESYAGLRSTATKGEAAITDTVIKGGRRRTEAETKELEKVRAIREKADRETVKSIEATAKALEEILKREAKETAEQVEAVGKAFHLTFGPTTRDLMRQSRAEILVMAEVAEQLYKQKKLTKEQIEQIRHETARWKTTLLETVAVEDDLAASAKETEEWFEQQRERKKELVAKQRESVEAMANTARTALDFGQAMGLVDDRTANVLNSVINIGSGFAKIMGGDLAGGITGVLGGLANVISGLGNSEAHRRIREAFATNTEALDRLSREIGNFDLNASGRTFTATQGALQAAFGAANTGANPAERGRNALQAFRTSLISQGVSVRDAEQLLKDLGFDPSLDSPVAFYQNIQRMLGGLGSVEFGQFGQDFESQLRAVQEGFDIFGIEDPREQFRQLSDLARRFSPALASALASGDPQGALKGLFSQLQTGGLSASDFGSLNAGQFLDLLKLLLPIAVPTNLGGIEKATGGGAGSVGGLGVLGNLASTGGISWAAPDMASAGATGLQPLVAGDLVVNNYFPDITDPKEAAKAMVDELDALMEYRRIQAIAATGAATI